MKQTFFNKKILIIPLLMAAFIFLFDKLFGLDSVRKYTETRIEFSFYDEKKILLKQLEKYNRNKKPDEKLMILFGTSHMGEFSSDYIYKKYHGLTTYNFSAPFASPSFLYYYLTKIIDAGISIDYAVLEIIPENFMSIANTYALSFSYDWKFIIENREHFSSEELEKFATSNLFYAVRFPFRVRPLIDRLFKSQENPYLQTLQRIVREATMKNNGGIPNPILYEIPEYELYGESTKYYQKTFPTYKESLTQKHFYQKFLETCKNKNIKLLVFKTIVSPPLQKILNESSFYQRWWEEKANEAHKMGAATLNLAESKEKISCQKFVDVHHLSGGCYPELTEILVNKLKSME
ncbi:MAG: DUF1574 family protein [Leptospiraceae bacterium]|nr:DUF1574 family protein [Leptospiraceae bacterium]